MASLAAPARVLDAEAALSRHDQCIQTSSGESRRAKADQDYNDVTTLLRENTDLTRLSHDLAQEVHRILTAQATDDTK